jgi:pantetheine-phosphate adenylyltransferase
MNRVLSNEIETVFLMADNSYQSIASKLVKEIARLGGDTKNFVPSSVHKRLVNITSES